MPVLLTHDHALLVLLEHLRLERRADAGRSGCGRRRPGTYSCISRAGVHAAVDLGQRPRLVEAEELVDGAGCAVVLVVHVEQKLAGAPCATQAGSVSGQKMWMPLPRMPKSPRRSPRQISRKRCLRERRHDAPPFAPSSACRLVHGERRSRRRSRRRRPRRRARGRPARRRPSPSTRPRRPALLKRVDDRRNCGVVVVSSAESATMSAPCSRAAATKPVGAHVDAQVDDLEAVAARAACRPGACRCRAGRPRRCRGRRVPLPGARGRREAAAAHRGPSSWRAR